VGEARRKRDARMVMFSVQESGSPEKRLMIAPVNLGTLACAFCGWEKPDSPTLAGSLTVSVCSICISRHSPEALLEEAAKVLVASNVAKDPKVPLTLRFLSRPVPSFRITQSTESRS